MDGKLMLSTLLLATALGATSAHAASIELSGTGGYSQSDLGDGYTNLQRRYSGSIDFKFTSVSSIEFEYMDSYSRYKAPVNVGTLIPLYTDQFTTYKDQVFSVNWVQNLVPSTWVVQPYFVVGAGKMNRKVHQDRPGVAQVLVDLTEKSNSGTAGLGLRIFFLKNLAVKAEMKSYMPDFKLGTWKANQMLSLGLSWVL